MKTITVPFFTGIQSPPRLGSLILKRTADGKASYAQNVDFTSDEYGEGAVVPGPALTTIDGNSELTGVPVIRQFIGYSATPFGYLYFAQGVLGAKTVIRRVKDLLSGSTPSIDGTGSITAPAAGTHVGHANLRITDMILRYLNGSLFIYVATVDDSDVGIQYFTATDGSPSLVNVTSHANFTGGYTDMFLVYSTFNNNIYWVGRNRVDSIDTSNSHVPNALALGLPVNAFATAAADWQQQLVVAFSTHPFGNFETRKEAGSAGVAMWDYVQPAITKNIPAPCRYISALIPAPNGQLLVFGGVDEGKCSIYSFSGYGFDLLEGSTYIGDLPRSRHAVTFDGQGRIVWLTADGFKCRYAFATGKFENLGRASSTGGLLAKGIGSPSGNEFILGSGEGSAYKLQKVQFGSYIGDGGGSDSNATPMAVSGTQVLGQGETISAITLPLANPLKEGERIELRVYKNGSTTDYDTYLTMDYDEDYNDAGRISSKREVKTLDNINTFNLACVWKMADGSATAPAALPAIVEVEDTH
jgi:hypothetical protein